MNIIINFSKHISLGNVYDSSIIDNNNDFKNAQLLYNIYTFEINDRVNKTLKNPPLIKDKIITNVQDLKYSSFIISLEFEVEEIIESTLRLSLTKVNK